MFEKFDIQLSISFYVTLRADKLDEQTEIREKFLVMARNIFGAIEMSPTFVVINAEGIRERYEVELNKTTEAQEILKSIPEMFEEKFKLLRNKISEGFLVE